MCLKGMHTVGAFAELDERDSVQYEQFVAMLRAVASVAATHLSSCPATRIALTAVIWGPRQAPCDAKKSRTGQRFVEAL